MQNRTRISTSYPINSSFWINTNFSLLSVVTAILSSPFSPVKPSLSTTLTEDIEATVLVTSDSLKLANLNVASAILSSPTKSACKFSTLGKSPYVTVSWSKLTLTVLGAISIICSLL